MLRPIEKLKYVMNRLGFSYGELLAFPKFFLVETINACNSRCVMCGIDFSKKTKREMDTALFSKIVEEIGEHKDEVEKLFLQLDGEPLLDWNIGDRLRGAWAAGVPRINIATNASRLDKRMAWELILSGLDEIYITMDSIHKDTYESIRRGLWYEEVLENILRFIRLRDELNAQLVIRIQMIEQAANEHETEEFQHYWKEKLRPGDQVVIQKAHNWAGAVDVKQFGDEDTVNDIPCIALWGTMAVHEDGTVPLCCMDTESTVVLGDLKKQSIEEVWHGNALVSRRWMHLHGRRAEIPLCNGCTLWRDDKQEHEVKA